MRSKVFGRRDDHLHYMPKIICPICGETLVFLATTNTINTDGSLRARCHFIEYEVRVKCNILDPQLNMQKVHTDAVSGIVKQIEKDLMKVHKVLGDNVAQRHQTIKFLGKEGTQALFAPVFYEAGKALALAGL